MISFLIGLSGGLVYLWLGARFGSTLYVRRQIDRQINAALTNEIVKYGGTRIIPVNSSNDRAVEEMRRNAAVGGMWLIPFWPVYVGAVKTHEYVVKNSHTSDYDRRKREQEQAERVQELQKRIDELEKQDANWREENAVAKA